LFKLGKNAAGGINNAVLSALALRIAACPAGMLTDFNNGHLDLKLKGKIKSDGFT
jgi:hypothetical protein